MADYIERHNGRLYIDGCDAVKLAEEYGTPLYVMSQSTMADRVRELKECFSEKYPKCRIAYASKAFSTLAMMKFCLAEGLYVEAVSGGDLFIAKSAGVPGDMIELNGNNKTPQELREAIEYGVGRIIVDGLTELDLIESVHGELAREGRIDASSRVGVLFRITPGVKADTHDHMVTGKKDSKFGIPLDDEIFYPLVEQALNSNVIEFMGLHFHIGSQLFDASPYLAALEIALAKVVDIRERFGYTVGELNLGGGFGVNYTDEDVSVGRRRPFAYFLKPMVERVHEFYDELGEEYPNLVIEPGRSIVAESGTTLYRIGQIKDVPGLKKYISVDGGMGDNIRPALYDAEYRVAIANRDAGDEGQETVTICGKYCESGDILVKEAKLPPVETGDILAVFTTGAYNYAMASNYNWNLTPAVVMCSEGNHRLIVKRQTYDQLIENQL